MKQISELTEQELLNLTEQEIEQIIKLECAQKGIKIPIIPKEPDYMDVIKPDLIHYVVGGIHFSDEKEAKKLLDILCTFKSIRDTKYASNWSVKIDCDHSNDFSVFNQKIYSETVWLQTELAYNSNDKKKEEYFKKMNEYHKEFEAYTKEASEVNKKIKTVKDKDSNRKMLKSIFKNEYLPLANGNTDIAMSFLKKAYNIDDSTEQYIIDNLTKEATKS